MKIKNILIIFLLAIVSFVNVLQAEEKETKAPVGRAVRAAMVEVSEYLDCVLYLKDECVDEYAAKDASRKESTKGTLDLF